MKKLVARAAIALAAVGLLVGGPSLASQAQSVSVCVKANVTVQDQTVGTGEAPVCVSSDQLPPPPALPVP